GTGRRPHRAIRQALGRNQQGLSQEFLQPLDGHQSVQPEEVVTSLPSRSAVPRLTWGCVCMVRLSLVLLAAAAVIPTGCSTHTDRLRAVRSHYYAGDLASTEGLLDKELEKAGGEEDVLLLE